MGEKCGPKAFDAEQNRGIIKTLYFHRVKFLRFEFHDLLTPQERVALRRIAGGKTNKKIADEMGIAIQQTGDSRPEHPQQIHSRHQTEI